MLYSVVVDHINVTDIFNSLTIFDYNSMSKLNYQHESMDIQNNDLTNNIYHSNNAIAMKLKQLEKIQNTIHSEDQFGEQDNTLKYSILSFSIRVHNGMYFHFDGKIKGAIISREGTKK